MRAWRLVAAAALFLLSAAFVQQARPDRFPLPPTWTTQEQNHNLYNQHGIPPGLYQLRASQSDKCVGVAPAWGAEVAHLVLVDCTPETVLAFIPFPYRFHPGFSGDGSPYMGYTIRVPSMASDRGRYTHCVTKARGVVFGSPRLDVLPCETGNAGLPWQQTDGSDQVHSVSDKGAEVFEVIWGWTRGNINDKCWDVRDSGVANGTDLLLNGCRRRVNQQFELVFVSPLSDEEMGFMRAQGWRSSADGVPRLANFASGVDLPGSDYDAGPSPNDGGAFCAASCAIDSRCKSFTWAEPGVGDERAMCWLKDSHPAATQHSRTVSGYVRTWRGRRLAG
jgi:hypothetical protein